MTTEKTQGEEPVTTALLHQPRTHHHLAYLSGPNLGRGVTAPNHPEWTRRVVRDNFYSSKILRTMGPVWGLGSLAVGTPTTDPWSRGTTKTTRGPTRDDHLYRTRPVRVPRRTSTRHVTGSDILTLQVSGTTTSFRV